VLQAQKGQPPGCPFCLLLQSPAIEVPAAKGIVAADQELGSTGQPAKATTAIHRPEIHSGCHVQALYLARDLLMCLINSYPNQTEPYAFHA
jgi:hypothetical protein